MQSLQLSPREIAIIEEAKRRGLIGQKKEVLSYPDWYRSTIPSHWGFPRHIEFLCDLIQQVIDGKLNRVALSLPPGHGKSTTVTQRFPIYWGLKHPNDTTVLTGYSQTFAEKNLSRPSREVAEELGILDPTSQAMEEWRLRNGARIIARGVGSAPTGINPIGLLVADDPLKDRAQANSEIERENLWQWWQGSIIQRFWPRTSAFIIATRWHHDDLIGRLKAVNDGTWTFINLPAIAESDDPLGRAKGEALWPEGKPIEFLEQQRTAMGAYEFESLFQGNPTPREGNMFKVDRFQFCDASDLPKGLVLVRGWDIASSSGKGDYTAGVLIGRDSLTGRYYIVHVHRGQWDTDVRRREILSTAQMDGKTVRIIGPQDPGAAGKDAALEFVRMLAGFSVSTELQSGEKTQRADAFSAQVNAGNVTIVRGEWNSPYIEELRTFPSGRNDDQVDASSSAFNAVVVNRGKRFFAV